MEWFKEAKLGIFIHWGIYAVNGISESWSFYNGYISHEDYLKQTDGFTAKNYDPNYWAELIKESGAKYAVLTTKHHDGVALWDTKCGDLNVVDKTPAKIHLVKPFASALRKNNLKVTDSSVNLLILIAIYQILKNMKMFLRLLFYL